MAEQTRWHFLETSKAQRLIPGEVKGPSSRGGMLFPDFLLWGLVLWGYMLSWFLFEICGGLAASAAYFVNCGRKEAPQRPNSFSQHSGVPVLIICCPDKPCRDLSCPPVFSRLSGVCLLSLTRAIQSGNTPADSKRTNTSPRSQSSGLRALNSNTFRNMACSMMSGAH